MSFCSKTKMNKITTIWLYNDNVISVSFNSWFSLTSTIVYLPVGTLFEVLQLELSRGWASESKELTKISYAIYRLLKHQCNYM